jgi:hypothetical protein
MAGGALTTMSSLQCPHGGTVQITSSNKASAGGGTMVTTADTFTVSGCSFQIPATPPIPSPCATVQWVVADMRSKVNGAPTLSTSSVGLCLSAAQVPQGPVVIAQAQTQVTSE